MTLEGCSKKRNTRILLEMVFRCFHTGTSIRMSIIHFICYRVFAYTTGNLIGCFHIRNMASKTHHGNYCVYIIHCIYRAQEEGNPHGCTIDTNSPSYFKFS